jgi:hypothetical protein
MGTMRADGHTLATQEWVVTEGWDAGRGRWYCLELRPATSGEVVDKAEHEDVIEQPIYSGRTWLGEPATLVGTWVVQRRRHRQRRVSGVEAVQILRRITVG